MAEDDSQEKTEDPTERRLEKSIEDGQLLSSKDTFVFTTMTMGLFSILVVAKLLPAELAVWSNLLVFGNQEALDTQILVHLGMAFKTILVIGGLFGIPMFVIVICTQALVGGLHFMPKSMQFKGSRLNPISGLGRIISVKGLVTLGQAILKVTFIGLAAGLVIAQSLPQFLALNASNLGSAIERLFSGFTGVFLAILLVMAVIAAIDYSWQLYQHTTKLKMSMKELKDENKESNGSPEVKQRIRRLQMEASRRATQTAEALDKVGEATAVITNPTHFAVALKYTPGEPGAPIIIAMGKGHMAKKIIEKATGAGVTVFRSPLLARALFFTGDIGQEISDRLYGAVAAALAYIYKLDRGEVPAEPDLDLPDDLRFNEDGKVL